MSLMGTLAKVAVGIIAAKGVGKLMNSGGSSSGGGLGGLLGDLASSNSGGGLGSMLSSTGVAGGLGSLLGGLTGGSPQHGGAAGGLGALLNQLGGSSNTQQSSGIMNFGDLFNTALQGQEPEVSAEDEQHAALMLRAMISAAKADGKLDSDEKRKIMEHLGDISDEEARMVRAELQAPLDVQSLVRDVPRGMEQQVYLMSLLAITLDTQEEAQYMDRLRQNLGLSQEVSNQIHAQLGVPKLYS